MLAPMQGVNPKIIVAIIIGLIVVASLSTAFYSVPANSVGIVTRFGRMTKSNEQPGLHFKLPFRIDRVVLVPVKRQLKQEFGFATPGATNPSQYLGARARDEERNMITGDRNAVSVEWIIQYRIGQPDDYLFRVRNPGETLRDVSESVMRQVIGDRTVDEVLTVGRQEIESEAKEKMQILANDYQLGLRINLVQLQDVNPPTEAVKASFNQVNGAQQEKESTINKAWAEHNKDVPQARGKADQSISQARGYASQRENEAEGDATRFIAVFEEYKKAPEVTKRRLYLETLGDVVPKLGSKIIIDENARQVLPLLQLPGTGK